MFKKGDTVLSFGSWNDRGAVSVSRLVIQSWGKIQGTATIFQSGKFSRTRFYTDRVNTNPSDCRPYGSVMILESECADVEAFAMHCGRSILAVQRAHFEARIERNKDTGSAGYVRAMREALAALQSEPTLIDRREVPNAS